MSDAPKSEFDNAKYRSSLDLLINKAYDEYKISSVDVPKLQAGYIRTYLWISFVVAAFELRLFVGVMGHDFQGIFFLSRQATPCFHVLMFLAIGLSFAVFALAVDTMRGRGAVGLPLGDPMQLAKIAYADAQTSEESMRPSALAALHNEIMNQTAQSTKKAKRLRTMSCSTLASIFIAVLAIIALATGAPIVK